MTAGLREVARFGTVGLLATAVHLGVAMALAWGTALPVLAVHATGFACAFGISFAGHYAYTFRSERALGGAMLRFLAVSGCALGASSAVAAAGAWFGLTPGVSLLVAAASVPVASYVASRELVF